MGIIGFRPPRSWAAAAHVPAILGLVDDFTLIGIANSTAASAAAAVEGLPGVMAFPSVEALLEAPEVDLVTITVKVPQHAALVRKAVAAGKHVLCEWPLARSLAEAQELVALSQAAGTVLAVGLQAGFSPAIRRLAAMRDEGVLGRFLSSSIIGYGMTWGAEIEQRNTYLLDPVNAATMLTIAVGHMLSAVEIVLGPIASVAATLVSRRTEATVIETGERIANAVDDQVVLTCICGEGVPLSLHFRGGLPRGKGLTWLIDGTEASARLSSPSGLIEMAPLTLETSVGDADAWQLDSAPVETPIVAGVRSLYSALAARLNGRPSPLSEPEQAVRIHRLIAAIECSAASGRRVDIS